jgi:hypothetical protein
LPLLTLWEMMDAKLLRAGKATAAITARSAIVEMLRTLTSPNM